MDEEAPALLLAPSPERAGASPPAGGRNELVPSPKRLLLILGCVAALLLGAHALTVQGKAAESKDLFVGRRAESCSVPGQDCRTSQCCTDPAMRCFEKDQAWAGCKVACAPGVDSSEPAQYQTPWSCTPLGAGAAEESDASETMTEQVTEAYTEASKHLFERFLATFLGFLPKEARYPAAYLLRLVWPVLDAAILSTILKEMGPVMNTPVIFVRFIMLHIFPIVMTGSVAFGAHANSWLAVIVQLLLALDTGAYVIFLVWLWAEPAGKRQLLAPDMRFKAVVLLAVSPLVGLIMVRGPDGSTGSLLGFELVIWGEPLIFLGSLLGWGLSSAGWLGVGHSHIFMVGLAVGFFHAVGFCFTLTFNVKDCADFQAVATEVK